MKAFLPSFTRLTLPVGAPTPKRKLVDEAAEKSALPEPAPWVPTPLYKQPIEDVYNDYGNPDNYIANMGTNAERDPLHNKLVLLAMDVELYLGLSRIKGPSSTDERWEEFWGKDQALYKEWDIDKFKKPAQPSMQVRWDGEHRKPGAWVVQPMEEGRHRAWWIRYMLGYKRLVVLVLFQWNANEEGGIRDDEEDPTGKGEVIATPDTHEYEAVKAVWSNHPANVKGKVYSQLVEH